MLIQRPAARSVRSGRVISLATSLNSSYTANSGTLVLSTFFLISKQHYSQAPPSTLTKAPRKRAAGTPKRINSKIFLKSDRHLVQAAFKSLESDLDASVSVFSGTMSSDSDLAHELGKPVVHNVRLEAAMRMIADTLLLYKVIDSKINAQRLELQLSQDSGHQSKSENGELDNAFSIDNFYSQSNGALETIYPGVPMDIEPLDIDSGRLARLSRRELDELHMYLAKYLVHRDTSSIQRLYNKYLHSHIHTSGGSIALTDDQQRQLQQKQKQHGTKQGTSSVNIRTARLNQLLRGALAAAGPRPEQVLSEASRILMTFGALPNLETFNILIRQLTLYRLEMPARLVYEVVRIAERQPLGKELYNSVCRLAIGSGNKAWFLDLARVYDFNNVTTRDGQESPLNEDFWRRFNPIRMSSYMAHEWLECRPHDLELRKRFFGSDEAEIVARKMNSTHIYTTLISGFVAFGWHWWVDGVLRKMAAEGLPLPVQVLTLNFRAAAASQDKAKVLWTWRELVGLPERLSQIPLRDINGNVVSRVFYDEEVYLAARAAALAVGDRKLLAEIELYNSQMTEQRLCSGHLMMEIPPDYAPFDLSGDRGEKACHKRNTGTRTLAANKQHQQKPAQSFASVITNALFAKSKPVEPEQEPQSVAVAVGPRYGVLGSAYRGARNVSAAQAGQSLAGWQRRRGIGEDTEVDWVAALDQARLKTIASSSTKSGRSAANSVPKSDIESLPASTQGTGGVGTQGYGDTVPVSGLQPSFVVKGSGTRRRWFELW